MPGTSSGKTRFALLAGHQEQMAQPDFAAPIFSSTVQNERLSFTRTQRPFLICCTCVTVLAR
jgi:hypothetical protein